MNNPIVSAGNSEFYDFVIDRLRSLAPAGSFQVLVRSGCYLTYGYRR